MNTALLPEAIRLLVDALKVQHELLRELTLVTDSIVKLLESGQPGSRQTLAALVARAKQTADSSASDEYMRVLESVVERLGLDVH